ncbi:hypothetical protein [Streptomyces sp. NRRL F-5193]|uniref:hypothetical protein n=1 Tax=Streptomyces sp. NRRL F-5193 TaxID=1463860 RepID=UPI00131E9832|nr:hypothetical protein [Streptomyces sp. NRRL F-5193]
MGGGVQDFVNRYRIENDGRDPFDDCLMRSGGVASWGYDDGHGEFLSTAIAELMRLAMARDGVMSIEDLRIDSARDEFFRWMESNSLPGSTVWPPSIGERSGRWRHLFLDSSPEELRLHLRRAESVLTEFAIETKRRRPETVPTFGNSTRKFVNPVTGVTFYGIV